MQTFAVMKISKRIVEVGEISLISYCLGKLVVKRLVKDLSLKRYNCDHVSGSCECLNFLYYFPRQMAGIFIDLSLYRLVGRLIDWSIKYLMIALA